MPQSISAERNAVLFQDAEDLFQSILEAAPSAMVVTKEKGKIHYANRHAEVLLGHEREQLIGSRITSFIPSYIIPGVAVKEEHSLFHRNGKKIPVEISCTDIDGIIGNCTVLALVEISERRLWQDRLDTLKKKVEDYEQERDEMLHRLVHDLKEPLRAITSYAQLLSRKYGENVDETGKEFLKFIQEGAQRMGLMIEKLNKNEQISRHFSSGG